MNLTERDFYYFAFIGLFWLWFRLRLRAQKKSIGKKAQKRFKRANKGENEARQFLIKQGFHIEGEQKRVQAALLVDGQPQPFEVRVDILATRKRKRYVIEVKTGTQVVDPNHIQTRRQLREYAALFPKRTILLLDMEVKRLYHIQFD